MAIDIQWWAHASPIAGANSIHGFITVQITTIYLWLSCEGLGQREKKGRRKEGRGERRSATLHSEVFHFNGPPGDWLTLLEDPSPFQHNGPLHYLFALANVPPEATALVSTSFHFRVRLIANTESTSLPSFLLHRYIENDQKSQFRISSRNIPS